MGYDGHLRVLDLDSTARCVREHGPELVAAVDGIADPPDRLGQFRDDVAAAVETLDSLEAGTDVDLTTLVDQLLAAGRRLDRRVVAASVRLWTRTTGGAMPGRIPDEIEERTQRGAELWRKLVAAGTRDWEYELTIDGRTYRFERGVEGMVTSLLAPEEAEDLHRELEAVLPAVTDVYDAVYPSPDRQSIARSVRVVEGIYGLCWVAKVYDKPLVYSMSV